MTGKGEFKLSTFMIAMIVISSVTGLLTYIIVGGAAENNLTFDNTTFIEYQQFERLQNQTAEINSSLKQLQDIDPTSITGAITFAGAFVEGGWQLVKTTFTSMDIFTTMSDKAAEQATLGAGLPSVKIMVFLIVFILFSFAVAGILLGRSI